VFSRDESTVRDGANKLGLPRSFARDDEFRFSHESRTVKAILI